MSGLMDEPRMARPMRKPTASHAKVRALTEAPKAVGARWVEAARTELGALSAVMADELSAQITPGFANERSSGAIGTAETAFMLAIDDAESATLEQSQRSVPRYPSFSGPSLPAPKPVSPIVGQTDSTGPMTTPRRAARGIDAEAVRAVLSQPTAALLPAVEPSAPSSVAVPVLATPAKPRAKSFAPTPKVRARSFVSRLGVPVVPPPTNTAPMSTSHRMVVTHGSRNRSLNMVAAILSGLAAAMAVMAVVVSV